MFATKTLLVLVLIGAAVAVLAACGGRDTEIPTPTPTPTPSSTVEPAPTSGPTPTPTPAPSGLEEIAQEAAQSLVRLEANGRTWSGVMVDGSGLVLTTARNLGQGPAAEVTTNGGGSFQAWVVGRDDHHDVALLRLLDAEGHYAALQPAAEGAPGLGEEVALLGFGSGSVRVRLVRVAGAGQVSISDTQVPYVQLDAGHESGAEGGALVDGEGRLRGMVVSAAHVARLELSETDMAHAADLAALAALLAELENGRVVVLPPVTDPDAEPTQPQLPAVFSGSVTFGGQTDGAGRVYAQVVVDGGSDRWFSAPVESSGRYFLTVGIMEGGYSGAEVRFWAEGVAAEQTAVYRPGDIERFDLVFP